MLLLLLNSLSSIAIAIAIASHHRRSFFPGSSRSFLQILPPVRLPSSLPCLPASLLLIPLTSNPSIPSSCIRYPLSSPLLSLSITPQHGASPASILLTSLTSTMSNPAASASFTPPGMAASPLPPSVSIPTPSSAPRIYARKRSNVVAGSASAFVPDYPDAVTPIRRRGRETSPSSKDGDPTVSTDSMAAGEEIVPERSSVPRYLTRSVAQVLEESHILSTKPHISPQAEAKPSIAGDDARPHRLNGAAFRTSLFFSTFIVFAGLVTAFLGTKTPSSTIQVLSMEGQVAELDELLRKTAKAMQMQLDLVDMKIHKEIEGLREELEDKLDETAISFGTELRNMQARTHDIEGYLMKLVDAQFPTRQDVLNLVTTVMEETVSEGEGETLSLDDIRAVAKHIVEAGLEKYAADGIGRVDYALGTGGGKVIHHSEGYYEGLKIGWRQLAGSFLPGANQNHPLANKILAPSFGEPGQCLPLRGSNAYVEIALRSSIFPEAFSLEHVSKNVAYDISSAPKDFRVYGWLDSISKYDAAGKSLTQSILGEFTYDISKKNVQTFAIPEDSMSRGKLINMVKLEVLSNYGNPSYTCLYRFRVHGSDFKAILPSAGLGG